MEACNEAQRMIGGVPPYQVRYKRPDTSDYQWLNDCERNE